MDLDNIKFNEQGLVPAIAQDASTGEVLMLAYMNKEALSLTLSTGRAHYWSRSRKALWLKGDTSGNYQNVKSVLYDCDGDTILLLVEPLGPACHTGERTCFYRSLDGKGAKPTGPRVLTELYSIIKERKKAEPDKSYVASLYARGLPKILEKVAEESAELIEAAREKGKDDVVYEFCDLLFHSMVLLSNEGIEMDEAYTELARR
ncbi:MAG: bifunctional phosphoribosyl-AMP cyclohydrolase/phosphoribosyl-ATP diphosphatase HisIE, partial [Deltaproteobacteria bacterium]|nr:bifunctional phosphoribosyl-AMP cyclohydrolase/phosphoribosyl-ATP diphosphatase HisIE [Deltaproteobacteria bacterium]